jgi:hypothetical protein
MSRLVSTIATLALGAAAAACSGQIDAPLSSTFGQALASMDNQIIDPTPAVGVPETSAAKGVLAIERYENDRVKPPAGAHGEAGGGGGSGDDSGGSGGGGDAKK